MQQGTIDIYRECRLAYVSGRNDQIAANVAKFVAATEFPRTSVLVAEYISHQACRCIGKAGSSFLKNERSDRARNIFKMLFHYPHGVTLLKVHNTMALLHAKYGQDVGSVLTSIFSRAARRYPEQMLSVVAMLAAYHSRQPHPMPLALSAACAAGCLAAKSNAWVSPTDGGGGGLPLRTTPRFQVVPLSADAVHSPEEVQTDISTPKHGPTSYETSSETPQTTTTVSQSVALSKSVGDRVVVASEVVKDGPLVATAAARAAHNEQLADQAKNGEALESEQPNSARFLKNFRFNADGLSGTPQSLQITTSGADSTTTTTTTAVELVQIRQPLQPLQSSVIQAVSLPVAALPLAEVEVIASPKFPSKPTADAPVTLTDVGLSITDSPDYSETPAITASPVSHSSPENDEEGSMDSTALAGEDVQPEKLVLTSQNITEGLSGARPANEPVPSPFVLPKAGAQPCADFQRSDLPSLAKAVIMQREGQLDNEAGSVDVLCEPLGDGEMVQAKTTGPSEESDAVVAPLDLGSTVAALGEDAGRVTSTEEVSGACPDRSSIEAGDSARSDNARCDSAEAAAPATVTEPLVDAPRPRVTIKTLISSLPDSESSSDSACLAHSSAVAGQRSSGPLLMRAQSERPALRRASSDGCETSPWLQDTDCQIVNAEEFSSGNACDVRVAQPDRSDNEASERKPQLLTDRSSDEPAASADEADTAEECSADRVRDTSRRILFAAAEAAVVVLAEAEQDCDEPEGVELEPRSSPVDELVPVAPGEIVAASDSPTENSGETSTDEESAAAEATSDQVLQRSEEEDAGTSSGPAGPKLAVVEQITFETVIAAAGVEEEQSPSGPAAAKQEQYSSQEESSAGESLDDDQAPHEREDRSGVRVVLPMVSAIAVDGGSERSYEPPSPADDQESGSEHDLTCNAPSASSNCPTESAHSSQDVTGEAGQDVAATTTAAVSEKTESAKEALQVTEPLVIDSDEGEDPSPLIAENDSDLEPILKPSTQALRMADCTGSSRTGSSADITSIDEPSNPDIISPSDFERQVQALGDTDECPSSLSDAEGILYSRVSRQAGPDATETDSPAVNVVVVGADAIEVDPAAQSDALSTAQSVDDRSAAEAVDVLRRDAESLAPTTNDTDICFPRYQASGASFLEADAQVALGGADDASAAEDTPRAQSGCAGVCAEPLDVPGGDGYSILVKARGDDSAASSETSEPSQSADLVAVEPRRSLESVIRFTEAAAAAVAADSVESQSSIATPRILERGDGVFQVPDVASDSSCGAPPGLMWPAGASEMIVQAREAGSECESPHQRLMSSNSAEQSVLASPGARLRHVKQRAGAPRIEVRDRLAEIVIPANVTPRTAAQLEAMMEVDIILSKATADVWHNQIKHVHGNTFMMSHGNSINAQVALSLVKTALKSAGSESESF